MSVKFGYPGRPARKNDSVLFKKQTNKQWIFKAFRKYNLNGLNSMSFQCPLKLVLILEILSINIRPEARYGLPPPKGNFVDHDCLEASRLASFFATC